MKIILILLMAYGLKAQPWVMFNDLDDTYLYDQASGQVYIRVKKGGKNYEDTFVKMGIVDKSPTQTSPSSQINPQVSLQTKTPESPKNSDSKKEQQELLKKAQEIQRSLQNGIFEAE